MICSDFLSFDEMAGRHGIFHEKLLLDKRLIFGYHQDIITEDKNDKRLKLLDSETALTLQNILKSEAEDILFKIFPKTKHISSIRQRLVLKKILTIISLKIGQEISYSKIAEKVNANDKTVSRYLTLLEEANVVFRLGTFSNGFSHERSHTSKFYFFDCGIRNALIDNFNAIERRNDWDALWENFVIAERIKYKRRRRVRAAHFYWKTFNRQQVPLIEEKQGLINAYLLSWSEKPKFTVQFPDSFKRNYPEAYYQVLQPRNIERFVARKSLPYEIWG